ncbi:MAG: ADP-glyceromanno-heptose 6-epimerase [Candidatus Omnitrophica bacterium]|nr:ADP-glyceromanno-heptose 6-epimerase [Candidatus Omnitrophota bacterium]MCM8794130.1 ADP-glyceromanno-heptose 6-epimerase [Candidatus Omnitrophota bacterium]
MVILTGGAGFIGSCFLWKLNQEGISDILVVDELDSSEKWKNLRGKKFLDYLHKNDLWQVLEKKEIRGVKKIIHLGACTSTTIKDAEYLLKNNYEYSKRLAIWALEHKAHFIYASSAATYGDGSSGFKDDEALLPSLRPLNIYGYSKHLFDLWVFKNDLFKKCVGIKFFNVFGPNEYHKQEMMSLIARRFKEVKEGKPFYLFKSYRKEYRDGEQKRDFVYVKDVIEVVYFFYKNQQISGLFNLGTGKARTWNDLAKALFSALGLKPVIEYIDMPEEMRGQYQYFTEAEMDKLNAVGCKHKFMSLEEAVKDYVAYLKENAYL